MIIFCYGTTAEAIKLSPLMKRLDARGVRYEQWLTLQQAGTVLAALPDLGIRTPDHILAVGRSGRALQGPVDVVVWLAHIAGWAFRHRRMLRGRRHRRDVVVVHGDTMTSVVGAVLARLAGLDCAHVEAGLRSGNWRHPFPEELDRRVVGRIATLHYAPTEVAARHLRGRADVVMTHGNTVVDAVLDHAGQAPAPGEDPYGVVLLHRFELLGNPTLVRRTLDLLVGRSPHRLVMVVDDLARHALGEELARVDRPAVEVVDKMPHARFTALLAGAAFVVTDSGGVQEETAMLGVPTLVHRRATERSEGLGANVLLSGWDLGTLAGFLDDVERYRREPVRPSVSPSDLIVDDLVGRGYTRD
jgi:UDP-N-acetylglucosamine 2-epimerase (non-hydrolysing)